MRRFFNCLLEHVCHTCCFSAASSCFSMFCYFYVDTIFIWTHFKIDNISKSYFVEISLITIYIANLSIHYFSGLSYLFCIARTLSYVFKKIVQSVSISYTICFFVIKTHICTIVSLWSTYMSIKAEFV